MEPRKGLKVEGLGFGLGCGGAKADGADFADGLGFGEGEPRICANFRELLGF